MTLERIWAGWRSEYVSGLDDSDQQGCVLCRVLEEGSHVVWRGSEAAVVLNAYPYTSGHVIVLPRRHVAEPEELTAEEGTAVWSASVDAVRALRAAYSPDGVNLGVNLGRVAGAGVPGHFHVHVLPRWSGDSNFMTTVAEVRVLPEALPVSREKLRAAWTALA